MDKKAYIIPSADIRMAELPHSLMQPSAPGEGIGYGGEGSDEDDPSSKERKSDEDWGSLW